MVKKNSMVELQLKDCEYDEEQIRIAGRNLTHKRFGLEFKPKKAVRSQHAKAIPVELWGLKHSAKWLIQFARKREIDHSRVNMYNFKCTGKELMRMSKEEFVNRDSVHGSDLFEELQIVINKENDTASTVDGIQKNTLPVKRTRNKNCRLIWKFLLELLHDPIYCPEWIRWENAEEGTFRLVKKDRIAKKWGSTSKAKNAMTYEKFSRAIRQNYASEMLASVPSRLVYRFGSKATGWRHDNPNFVRKG